MAAVGHPALAVPRARGARRIGVDAYSLGLAALLLVLAILPILVSPVGEFPVDDDWAYAQVVQHVLLTGTYQHAVWIDTAFVAQAWWGVLASRVLGFSHTSLRLGTLLAAVALVLSYVLLCRALRPPLALATTLLLLFHPLFLHLAYTFMTDVPFLALMLAAIWCVSVAFESGDRPARLAWLAAGSALIGLACLVRQIGIVLVPAGLLGALPELRASRVPRWRLLAVLVVPFGAVLAVAALAAGPRDVSVEARFVDLLQVSDPASLLQLTLTEIAVSAALLGLSVLPAAPLLWTRPGILGWSRWQKLLAAGLLLLLAWATWSRASAAPTPGLVSLSPLFGNTLSAAGFTVSGLHPHSITLDTTAISFIAVLGLVGAATLVLTVGAPSPSPSPVRGRGGLISPLPRTGEGLGEGAFPSLPIRLLALSSAGVLAATLAYGPIGGPVNGLYDRYLLPVLPGVLAVTAYAVRERRTAAPLFLIGAVLFAGWSVSWQREYLARQAAVWTVAGRLVEAGIPAAEIDAGYEWAGWTRGDAVIEQARAAALQAGQPRQFVQRVVDGLYRPHAWYVGFGPLGWGCAGQPQVEVPYGDGFTAYGLRRCRPRPPTSPLPAQTLNYTSSP